MAQQDEGGATPLDHVVIVGHGLAAAMTVAALSRQLPAAIRITYVRLAAAPDADLLYGSVTGPTAYAFNRNAGVEEPRVLLDSDTAFSWGTKYDHWAKGERSWIQSFQLPLPVLDGILFHQYLARERIDRLEPYLVSAVAARKGAFVHPPEQPEGPGQGLLANAEYGYQFDPSSYAALFEAAFAYDRIQILDAGNVDVERDGERIVAVRLDDGQRIGGGLFVDCSGPRAVLLSALGSSPQAGRTIGAAISYDLASQLGPPIRTIAPTSYGWRSETPLQGRRARLTVYDPADRDAALADHTGDVARSCEAQVGPRASAWLGNCVAIGQSACVAEPLTVAPILLLERDIERFITLLPLSGDMAVERREYSRRAAEDYEHAGLFTQALFQTTGLPEDTYWAAARGEPVGEKLARKVGMFESRGLLVSYDLEPFHPEDWTVLHYGMGRRPARHDRLADRAPADRIRAFLSGMKQEVEKLVGSLPPHATYMEQLKLYLQKNKL